MYQLFLYQGAETKLRCAAGRGATGHVYVCLWFASLRDGCNQKASVFFSDNPSTTYPLWSPLRPSRGLPEAPIDEGEDRQRSAANPSEWPGCQARS